MKKMRIKINGKVYPKKQNYIQKPLKIIDQMKLKSKEK